MRLRRTRFLLTALIAATAVVLALVPLLMWRVARLEAIDDRFDAGLVAQMAEIQVTEQRAEPNTVYYAWYANANDGYTQPLSDELLLEPPLLTWIAATGTEPSFRDVTIDGTSFRAYVRPTAQGEGYVTLAATGAQDDARRDIDRRALILALGALVLSSAAGWVIAGLVLGPGREAVARQQDFLANAAHEMRTPLAVILASSSQALARSRTEEEYVRSLSEIRSAAERASAGVNELLELVRFDSGQAIPRLAPVRLDLLAEEVAASVRADDCEVIAEPTTAVVIQADMPLLRQALDNVVRNAVRRSGRIELRTERVGRDGVVTITDDGPGFDPAAIDTVFDRYQRGDRNGDVGIGLAIVKAIVSAHGGTVSAANVGANGGPSGGAIVTIQVPLDTAYRH